MVEQMELVQERLLIHQQIVVVDLEVEEIVVVKVELAVKESL